MNIKLNQKRGALYAISSGLCYGLIGYLGLTIIRDGLSIPNMLFWRFFIATLVMAVFAIPQYKTILQTRKQSITVVFSGMAFYALSTIVYFRASEFIGTGLAMVIFFTYPAMVMIFNMLYHKMHISQIYVMAFFVLIVGMLLMVDLHEFTFDLLGIGLAIVSALFYAGYILSSKAIVMPPSISTFMVSLGCMLSCLIAALLNGSFYIPQGIDVWLNIIAMALICTAIPILLLLEALKYIRSDQASMLSVLEPVFVVIFGIILLGETITLAQAIGTITVLAGALMTVIPHKTPVVT